MTSSPVPKPSLLKEVDYASFGNIIHTFAKFEHAIVKTLAHVSKLPAHKLIIVTQGLMYSTKRDTLYAYMELWGTDSDLKSQIKGFLDEVDKYNGLRNSIAHSIWTEGVRPGTVRPMSIKIRGGKGKLCGISDDGTEVDYTSGDLIDISNKLSLIHNSFVLFAIDNGIIAYIE